MRREVLFVAMMGLSLTLVTACTQPSEDATTSATTHTEGAGVVTSPAAEPIAAQEFPDVLAAELTGSGNAFTIAVTISSPYDTAQRYADGWRVLTPDGELLAEHALGHDHASEQPFTRTSASFPIPDDVTEVVVEGRDQANGYGGETVTIPVPR